MSGALLHELLRRNIAELLFHLLTLNNPTVQFHHSHPLLRLLAILLLMVLFISGAFVQGRVQNTDMDASDQSAYMRYAKAMHQTNWQFAGSRNRMPLYPALMSMLFSDGMSDEVYFERGKKVGILLALLVCIGIFLLFRSVSDPPMALAATLLAAFSVIVFKAPWFQADVLLYGWSLLFFHLAIRLIQKPSARLGALCGLIAVLAHLTKASILLSVLLLGFVLVVLAIQRGFRQDWKNAIQPMISILVMAFTFLLLLSPYLQTSKQIYGRYFYNVNSTFYIWYDSWEEASAGTKAHGDRIAWPDMPEEDIPSFHKYMEEHCAKQIVGRFTDGAFELFLRSLRSSGFLPLLILLLIFSYYRRREEAGAAPPGLEVLFVALNFCLYTALYAWYTPIADGTRLILQLFLPLIYICLKWTRTGWNSEVNTFDWLPNTILLVIAGYLLFFFPSLISSVYGGA